MSAPPMRPRGLVRIGRYAFLGTVGDAQPRLKFVFPPAHELDRARGSVALRRRLESTPAGPGAALPFAPIVYAGPCAVERGEVWGAVYRYLPGHDLGGMVRQRHGRLEPALAARLGCAAGVALGALHRGGDALDAPPDGEAARARRAALLAQLDGLASRLEAASPVRTLSAADMSAAVGAVRRVHRWAAANEGPIGRTGLTHGDLHGGNVIVDDAAGAGFIDDQLAVGDAFFDLVSLQNWSFEVLDDRGGHAFADGLDRGFGLAASRAWAPQALLAMYHAVRSAGRLAYYTRTGAAWTEPHGAGRLRRHVELLGRLADAGPSADGAVDPFDFFGRLRT